MITLPPLPYALNALEPTISESIVHYHYDKHHAGYVSVANFLAQGTGLENSALEDIILTTAGDTAYIKLFNNAAQVWNHNFYWNSLTPDTNKHQASPELLTQINQDFGSVAELKNVLIEKGVSQFGSGWVWLITENGQLKVISTSNADTPLVKPKTIPLLCVDVWEHAYYLDYQNMRKDYLTKVVQNLLNWEFASQNFHKTLD